VDTENLLVAAQVPEIDRVDVVKIQLSGVARSWWLAEESHLPKPISWKTFAVVFLAKFFPDTTKSEMEQNFINLRQAEKTVDEYAAEFVKLSQFAPYMISTEENRARRFQQGLDLELQRYVISFRYKTFAEVLTAAREQEQLSGMMARRLKCPMGQISGGAPARLIGVTPLKRQIAVPSRVKMAVCRYCHKTGHTIDNCRLAHNLCLGCGSHEHHVSQCPRN